MQKSACDWFFDAEKRPCLVCFSVGLHPLPTPGGWRAQRVRGCGHSSHFFALFCPNVRQAECPILGPAWQYLGHTPDTAGVRGCGHSWCPHPPPGTRIKPRFPISALSRSLLRACGRLAVGKVGRASRPAACSPGRPCPQRAAVHRVRFVFVQTFARLRALDEPGSCRKAVEVPPLRGEVTARSGP